jgi:hypothetical protein
MRGLSDGGRRQLSKMLPEFVGKSKLITFHLYQSLLYIYRIEFQSLRGVLGTSEHQYPRQIAHVPDIWSPPED